MTPSDLPVPHVLNAELARVRVAVARARDDIAEGRMPVMSDVQSLVAGVCAVAEQAARAGAADAGTAAALEGLMAELNALEQDVRANRDKFD
ncbi:MAG: hypothetical protein FJX42_06590 [Alphaproteobacteria bacterium]|nr:hypothetical protein [Alphaproteobacteria bacterium]